MDIIEAAVDYASLLHVLVGETPTEVNLMDGQVTVFAAEPVEYMSDNVASLLIEVTEGGGYEYLDVFVALGHNVAKRIDILLIQQI